MKHLIKQYLDHGISRRELLTGLGALGMSATAAKSLARSLASPLPQEGEERGGAPQTWRAEPAGRCWWRS